MTSSPEKAIFAGQKIIVTCTPGVGFDFSETNWPANFWIVELFPAWNGPERSQILYVWVVCQEMINLNLYEFK